MSYSMFLPGQSARPRAGMYRVPALPGRATDEHGRLTSDALRRIAAGLAGIIGLALLLSGAASMGLLLSLLLAA